MKASAEAFERLYDILARLRGPGGCPWDQEQSPDTMRGNLVEEAWECVEAINEKDPAHIREELGDVFLVNTMLAYMHEEQGSFSVADSLNSVCDKLIRRHPHVFGDSAASSAEEVLAQWQTIKVEQEGRKKKDSLMDEVKSSLHPLEKAFAMQKKAAKAGFDWLKIEDVWAKAFEELAETREACNEESPERLEEELGDLLFSVVNVARFLHVDPALALQRTISKFDRRFRQVEAGMKAQGKTMSAETFDLMDQLWEEAKVKERQEQN